MEMKYVVPDMAQSFGTLEFAGESEPVFERDKNNRRVLASLHGNFYHNIFAFLYVRIKVIASSG